MPKPNLKLVPTEKKAKLKVVRKEVDNTELIIEPHPMDYSGFKFITLIQYRKSPMLCIVDNVRKDNIHAYILDMCGPNRVDEAMMIAVAAEWWETSRHRYPLSVEYSRRGMTGMTGKVYRTLDVDSVSRVIGPMTKFPMDATSNPKRRRRKGIADLHLVEENEDD